MKKHYLTLEEANKSLSEIEVYLIAVMRLNKALDTMDEIDVEYRDEYEQLSYDINYNMKWHELSHQLFTKLHSLLNMGCMVKDMSLGIVDFPSMHDGKEILLCYQIGEESIGFWHESHAGYDERRPVEELFQSTHTD